MTIVIDLLSSWIIRASLIAIMLTLTVNMNNTVIQSNQQASAKRLLIAADSIIYSDVNMAGYNVSGSSFQTGTNDTTILFYGDLNGGGSPETVKYWVSYDNSTGLRKLYRYVNNENGGKDLLLGGNFTKVKFLYYTSGGTLTTTPANIVSVRVQLSAKVSNNVTSAYSNLTKSYSVSTDFKVYPANL